MNKRGARLKKNCIGLLVTIAFAGQLLGNQHGFAAEPTSNAFSMDEVLVTATRTLEEARKVPANVTIITAEEIKQKNITTVTDALKTTVGIFVDRPKGMVDTASGIEMRGFGESNILVMYDGMPMNIAYDGSVNWAAIPVDNIERIEIVRGAGSSLYGGRAVAGIINIITKTPMEPKIRLNTIYGSNNTWRNSISLSQKANDKFSYYLAYEKSSTDGFVNKVASSTSTGSASANGTVGYGVLVGQTVAGKPRYIVGNPGNGAGQSDIYNVKLKYNLDQKKNLIYSYTHEDFKYYSTNPESYIHDASGNPLYSGSVKLPNGKWFNFTEDYFADYYGRRKTDIHALKYEDTGNKIIVNLGVTDVSDSGYSTPDKFLDANSSGSDTAYPSKSYKLDFQKTWDQVARHTIVTGFSWQKDEMTRTNAKLSHWQDKNSITSITSLTGGKDDNLSFFVQDEYSLNQKWKMYTGVRWDQYKKYGGFYNATGSSEKIYADASYTELSPKIAFEYAADPQTTYYASYGHSFNPPSLYKLYRTDSSYIGNPDLEPERTNTIELGVKKQLGQKTQMGLSVYQAKTDNLITAASVTIDGTTKKWYKNLEHAKRSGVEFDLKHQFDKRWSGYLNYAWQRGEDESGEKIYSLPQDIFHAGITYSVGKWSTTFDAEYVSERNDPGQVSGVYLSYDGFFVANLRTQYRLNSNASLTFVVNNLFDKEYYLWYAAPRRTYTLGLQLEY